jgi:glucose-6-phosphate 1-dehydrogenase
MSNPLREGLATERIPDPCAVVIFGASGDLTKRKLVPALYNLAVSRLLPPGASVVGFARRPKTDDEFRSEQKESVAKFSRRKPIDEPVWNDFAQGLFYCQANYDDDAGYAKLKSLLDRLDHERGTRGNRLYYLSVPPSEFGTIVTCLREAGLIGDVNDEADRGFTRLVIEKPFGTDLASGEALDRTILGAFDERQVFRIDHYLGKETVQNLLVFRFANSLFEPLWSREHIEQVQITVAEDIGVEGRGSFYEEAGTMRDVVQNHLLQVLSLVAMEAPVAFDADAVRDEKTKVVRALRPIASADVAKLTVRGQYAQGTHAGNAVPAYREEADVSPTSRTETYVAIKAVIDNWRWGGVPFYLRAGKRLNKRVTEVSLHFKPVPHALFVGAGAIEPDVLSIRIQPDEGIALRFMSKVPGPITTLRPVTMDFRYGTSFGDAGPEAYERLILESMLGDATLFARSDEVRAAWQWCTPILHQWSELGDPEMYPSGSWGPAGADALLHADGRHWRRL